MRVLFLDIDGVIQLGTQYRFDHSNEEVHALCRELTTKYGNIFDYDKWVKEGSNPFWTVAAVYWDWNKDCLRELRRVLETTDAKIVLSSDWRNFGFEAMKALFRVYGLDSYYVGSTMPGRYRLSCGREFYSAYRFVKKLFKETRAGKESWMEDDRSWEIHEYLDRHSEVTGYAVVDDLNLEEFNEGHFVKTNSRKGLTKKVADSLIAAIGMDGGPFLLPETVRTTSELKFVRKTVLLENISP